MVMIKKRNLLILLLAAIFAGTALGGSVIMAKDRQMYADYQQMSQRYGELNQLQNYIEENYYVPVEEEGLKEGTYRGLFFGIGDPYSGYLSKEEYEKMMTSTSGEEFVGVGVSILPGEDGYITVISPIDGSPAAKAGILAGDRIVKVDGTAYDAASVDEAVSAMRGSKGSTVVITVLRDGEELSFSMKRAEVHTQTVKGEILPENIGYIRISSFEEKTGEDFKAQLSSMEKKKVSGLIIDLRDNPGGLVDQSIEVADELLDEGVITYTEDRKGNKEFYKSNSGKTELPYVILINGGSASASEIVASAVKDNHGGKLVGVTSFGKGIIQRIDPIRSIVRSDKSGAAVKMTIMQYFSPDGNVIQKKGVEPDIEVEIAKDAETPGTGSIPREKDAQLQKALELLQK